MLAEEAKAVAEHQRRRFNELVDVFDRPQPTEVMARLGEIVASAELRPGAVVLDVGTGAGVLIPLIQFYQPSTVWACDVAEKMLQRVHDKYSAVRTCHTDIASLILVSSSVDAIFMNGMYGNIADSPLRAVMRHACFAPADGLWSVIPKAGPSLINCGPPPTCLLNHFPPRRSLRPCLSHWGCR
jgi:predicted RNA methylase